MKILYVGPLMMINKLVPMSKRIFPNLEFDYITYERYTDAPDLLEHYDKRWMQFCFLVNRLIKFVKIK